MRRGSSRCGTRRTLRHSPRSSTRSIARGKKGTEAGRRRNEFETLCRDVLEPGLKRWRQYLHPILMGVVVSASVEYAAWRRRNGRLNFQDLLLIARDLLRDHAHVRRSFQERFLPILVDEFQDTDPIQAEILFYLTGDDAEERDWRRLVPKPGSLFVVGDPKQSIYRFRRADSRPTARSANASRSTAASSPHRQLRSTGRLCHWVNGVFARWFPTEATAQQAAWVPLEAQRPEGAPGVFLLRRARAAVRCSPSSTRIRRGSRARSTRSSGRESANPTTSSCCFARASSCRTMPASSNPAASPTSFREGEPSRTPRSS